MARKKKNEAFKFRVEATVPACLKPLVSNKKIITYIITRCVEGTSNKLYIFVVAGSTRKRYLVRFWCAFGGELTSKPELYDKEAFQNLINEKAEHGYRIVSDEDINNEANVYGEVAEEIDKYIKQLFKIPAGKRVPSNLTL